MIFYLDDERFEPKAKEIRRLAEKVEKKWVVIGGRRLIDYCPCLRYVYRSPEETECPNCENSRTNAKKIIFDSVRTLKDKLLWEKKLRLGKHHHAMCH